MSGGIDSSATVTACQEPGITMAGMFLDYGQPAARSEWEAAQNVAEHYSLAIQRIDLGFSLVSNSGEFVSRNALFILTAAGVIENRPLVIALGLHSLTEYYDTTPLFIKHMERILDGYSGGTITLRVPFLANTKAEVVQFAKEKSVPLHLTYSCERGNTPACMVCPSCIDRNKFYAN